MLSVRTSRPLYDSVAAFWRDTALLLSIAAVYFGTAKLGLRMAFVAPQVTAVWPPTGVALAAVLLLGYRVWPAIWIGAFLANATANEPIVTACGVATGNTLEALTAAWLLRRVIGFETTLDRVKHVLGLVVLAAVGSTIVSATIGTTSLALTGVQPWSKFGYIWSTWWVGDAIGDLVIAPVLLTWAAWMHRLPWRRGGEALVLVASLVVATGMVFISPVKSIPSGLPLEYIVFPFVIWGALRFGPWGTATVTLVASAVAIGGTIQGSGPFASANVEESLVLLQLFMGVVAVSGLLLAAVVAERGRAEEAVRRSQAELADFFENASIGLHWVGPDGTILRANKAELDLLGYARDEYVGHHFAEFHADRDVIEDMLRRLGRGETLRDCEARLRGKDGTIKHVLIDSNVLWEDGRFVHTRCFTRDITERRRAEHAVRESEARLRALADAMPAIVWTAAPDGTITFANAQWFRYCGLTPEENARQWPELVLHPDDHGRCMAAWTRALEAGVDYEIEVRNRRHDGEYRWFLTRAVPVRDSAGRITEWFGTTADIHDHKQIEDALRSAHEELKDASRAKDEFLAMLSHELRNPLGAITNAVSVLMQVSKPDDETAKPREIIARQVKQLSHLVDDLLDVSRLESGKIVLERQPVDLKGLAERCVLTLQEAGRLADITVRLTGEAAVVEGDPTRLEQVIANLLDNAVKYTPAGGRVLLSVERGREEAVLSVRDTGIGIAAEMLSRIFDPFRQVEQSLERAKGGLGLGLALVKRLVELHGGRVSAASPGPGHGSEFVVRLALSNTTAGDAAPAPVAASPIEARRILIVEDNQDAREALRLLLEAEGHRVEVAQDGHQGLAAILVSRPEIALIDVGLPGLDGYALAERVRAAPGGQSIRLVALTGYGQAQDRRRALEAGFDAHLVKPVEEAELWRVLGAPERARIS